MFCSLEFSHTKLNLYENQNPIFGFFVFGRNPLFIIETSNVGLVYSNIRNNHIQRTKFSVLNNHRTHFNCTHLELAKTQRNWTACIINPSLINQASHALAAYHNPLFVTLRNWESDDRSVNLSSPFFKEWKDGKAEDFLSRNDSHFSLLIHNRTQRLNSLLVYTTN